MIKHGVKKNKKTIKKNKEMSFSLLEMIIVAIISIVFGGVIGGLCFSSRFSVDNDLEEFYKTYNDLTDNYYKDLNKSELINAAIEGMITYLGDPYSIYMNDEETDNFNTTVSGEYKGIGVTVSIIDNKPTIISVFDDSPAAKSGIKSGDVIVSVNDKSVDNKELSEIVEMIKSNGNVVIKALRDGKEKTFKLKLTDVVIPSVSSKIFEKNNKKVGYINVSIFSANTYQQFNNKLNELETNGIDSLIIDVRDNPGGHLSQVTKILSLFMDKKHVLYQIKSNGISNKMFSLTNTKRTYKIAVLINGNSASASEILAGAIKESYKGYVVGTKSYGKGTVQKEYSLKSGSSIKYTTEEWLTPNGNSINKKGIEPTQVIELSEEYKNNPSYNNDNQLWGAIDIVTKEDTN